jgi:hypothetical protein
LPMLACQAAAALPAVTPALPAGIWGHESSFEIIPAVICRLLKLHLIPSPICLCYKVCDKVR